VHAKADIYCIIESMAENGVGILVVSYDIDEVVMLADRVVTLYQGTEVGSYSHTQIDKQKMLADIAGVSSL